MTTVSRMENDQSLWKLRRPKLYIDIDGVLLGKRTSNDHEICLAEGAVEFLEFALAQFDCYWLTTHANHGYIGPALRALKPYADKPFMELAWKVKPVKWATLKTEAIDLECDFYWLDDQLLAVEREILEEHGRVDRWIRVDTRVNYSDLVRARQHLARIIERI